MPFYTDDEEDVDIRLNLRHGHGPVPQPEYRSRPGYYSHGNTFLVAEHGSGRRSRSGSFDRPRSSSHSRPSPPQPIVINNRIYNDQYEDDLNTVVIDDQRDHYLVAHPHSRSHSRSHSHSRPRPVSFHAPPGPSAVDYELEQTRRELEEYQRKEAAEREAERMKRHMELKRLKEEREKREREDMIEEERKRAVKEYEEKQAKKAAQDKKDKEERDREYKIQMETDLRKAGMDETQIAIVMKKEGAPDSLKAIAAPATPVYTRMSRRHLSVETLREYRIEYEFDQDPDYILIKRAVPEHEQDLLWRHTREIRERRLPLIEHTHRHLSPPRQTIIEIEDGKRREPRYEIVRKKRKSPSRAIKFFAGV